MKDFHYPRDFVLQIEPEIMEDYLRLQLKGIDKEALDIVFTNLDFLWAYFTARVEPEDLKLREKFYQKVHPVNLTHCLDKIMEDRRVKRNPFLDEFIFSVRDSFRTCWHVDSQKQHGRPGSIADLREGFRRQSVGPDGSQVIEEDHWPFAKYRLERQPQGEIHYYLYFLQKPANEYEANDLFDMASIWVIQELERLGQWERRDREYMRGETGNKVSVSLFGPDGKKLRETFPLQLRDKYQNLVRRWDADKQQKRELDFFKAVKKYPWKKAPWPSSYLKEKTLPKPSGKQGEFESKVVSLDEEGKTLIDFLRAPGDSNDAILEDVIRMILKDGTVKDAIDQIILQNYTKSDRQAAKAIKEKTGRGLSRVAVLKRRKKLEELIDKYWSIREVLKKQQER